MSVRSVLIVLNVVVIVVLAAIGFAIAIRRRSDERTPQNLGGLMADDDLEGRRLERVLGWALICAAIFAVALPVYWLREPDRQKESEDYFDENSVERGAVLFANPGMDAYDSTVSLQCANCHGQDGGGGAAVTTYTDPDTGQVEQVSWTAPPLNTELLRFQEDEEQGIHEVQQVLNYGRPGTPMAAFGTPGGGPKNEQAINDLINYIRSIQLTPEEAQKVAQDDLDRARAQPQDQVDKATQALADAQDALTEVQGDPASTDADVADAEAAVVEAQRELEWAQTWAASRADVTDGQLLFELNCARCHTKNWSIFDPTRVNDTAKLGLAAGGGGGIGFDLREGDTERRFPAVEDHEAFVAEGSMLNAPYGDGGQGSGRMPGFGDMLTDDMIAQIVDYERTGLAENDPSQTPLLPTDTEEAP